MGIVTPSVDATHVTLITEVVARIPLVSLMESVRQMTESEFPMEGQAIR